MRKIAVVLTTFLYYAYASPALSATEKLERSIRTLDTRIDRLNKELNGLNMEAAALVSDREVLENREDVVSEKLKTDLNHFNKTLLTMVKLERQPKQASLLMDSLSVNYKRQDIMNAARKSIGDEVTDSREEIKEIEEIRKRKANAFKRVTSLQEEIVLRKERLDKILINQIKNLQLSDAERAEKLVQSLKISDMPDLRKLFQNRTIVVSEPKPESSPYKNLPAQGRVLVDYGDRDHVGIKSRGVTVATNPEAVVTSLKEGKVIYNGPFREYGHLVIVEHTKGSHSLYSGLGQSKVEVGDVVKAKSIIGYMPKKKNPHLYVEIRKDGEPIDPKNWLVASR